MSSSPQDKKPRVSILWKGKLFGICLTTFYTVNTRPDFIYYEFKDSVPEVQSLLQLHNFVVIEEAGEFAIDQVGSDIQELIDLLISEIEQRYVANTLAAYNKDINNGFPKH